MIDHDLPATQPIPTIDPAEAVEFLSRLREHTNGSDLARRMLGGPTS